MAKQPEAKKRMKKYIRKLEDIIHQLRLQEKTNGNTETKV